MKLKNKDYGCLTQNMSMANVFSSFVNNLYETLQMFLLYIQVLEGGSAMHLKPLGNSGLFFLPYILLNRWMRWMDVDQWINI